MSTVDLEEFKMDPEKVQIVDQFADLELITKDCDCAMEIWIRSAPGRTAMSKLSTVWRDKHMSIDTKLRLVNAPVFSVRMSGTFSCFLKPSYCLTSSKLVPCIKLGSSARRQDYHPTSQ